jgi:hypothetical protein
MTVRTDVLLWAQRVVGRKGAPAHQILEIAADAGLDAARAAFHKIARMAHPDLHRTTLLPEELELVTTAYGRAAAAFQEIRVQWQDKATSRIRPVRPTGASPPAGPAASAPAEESGEPVQPAQAMTSKALVQYRKAELCLRRGELTEAVLHLKLAIASDPQSAFLRTALAEVQTEIGKKP